MATPKKKVILVVKPKVKPKVKVTPAKRSKIIQMGQALA